MSDKSGSENAEGASDPVKGPAELFLQTLGLTDLIFGALALYLLRLWYGGDLNSIFPTTGNTWIDLGLLAAGAAFSGKIISLVALFWAALVEDFIERKNLQNASSSLKTTLNAYRLKKAYADDITGWEQVDLAAAYVTRASPGAQRELDRIRTTAVMGYSATVLLIPFALYLAVQRAAILLLVVLGVCGLFFILMGLIHQIDYLITLRNSLAVLLSNEHAEPQVISIRFEE